MVVRRGADIGRSTVRRELEVKTRAGRGVVSVQQPDENRLVVVSDVNEELCLGTRERNLFQGLSTVLVQLHARFTGDKLRVVEERVVVNPEYFRGLGEYAAHAGVASRDWQ